MKLSIKLNFTENETSALNKFIGLSGKDPSTMLGKIVTVVKKTPFSHVLTKLTVGKRFDFTQVMDVSEELAVEIIELMTEVTSVSIKTVSLMKKLKISPNEISRERSVSETDVVKMTH